MRVKLNCTYYHAKGQAAPGDELDVSDKDGKDLVDSERAVQVETKRAQGKKAKTGGDGDGADTGAAGTGQTDNPDTANGGQQ
ncbi:hypothetical protein B0T40_03225 [Chromobacterium haemolyticum]|uniref:hypothetical protein n=1 Tax=Chromobacterium haemolyticum TaxID=394935 RepID=UPI0009D9326F|nr:hypothetical protein [Chromobacterium haemolyticum]OQS39760.1 hypothetical protein B0T40_03225 [Chromobacterium haemolyticum]